MDSSNPLSDIVILDYNDLSKGKDLTKEIKRAYDQNGPGLLAVKNVPDYVKLKMQFLPLAQKLHQLDPKHIAQLENKEALWAVGYSRGVEKLSSSTYDIHKGSYYANPQYDVPTTDAALIKRAPGSYGPNIWPRPEHNLPTFEPLFKTLGSLIVSVGEMIAKQIDKIALAENPEYKSSIYKHIKESRSCKARLLYYHPIQEDGVRAKDSWCGWHNDHGSLTGLCSPIYINTKGEIIDNPDPTCGLHIKTRQGTVRKISGISKELLAFQIGECSQIVTGGAVQATPHCVQAAKYPESKTTGRCTFAVFMQPDYHVDMSLPKNTTKKQMGIERWEKGMDFEKFNEKTLELYNKTPNFFSPSAVTSTTKT